MYFGGIEGDAGCGMRDGRGAASRGRDFYLNIRGSNANGWGLLILHLEKSA